MSWTQPICVNCWNERNPDRQAAAILPDQRDEETCAYCGEPTQSGIYVRADPASVPFPAGTHV